MKTDNQQEKKPKKEVNILLLAMSTLNNNPAESSYYYENETNGEKGKYIGQLEPVVKYLTKDQNIDLHELYVLNTKETKETIKCDVWEKLKDKDKYKIKLSAFEYFKERCGVDKELIKDIDVDNLENAVYEISSKIQEHVSMHNEIVHIYIDIHGGPRSTFSVVDAVMMLIKKMNNVDIAGIYTVSSVRKEDEQGKTYNIGVITDCTKDFDIFDFVSGINEFLSFGRSEGLIEYNKKNVVQKNKEEEKLVNLINLISDGILLNRTNNFEKNLQDLSKQLNTKIVDDEQKSFYDSIKSLIKDNYKVTLQVKEHNFECNLLDNKYVNYFPAQLQWCINKKHYQQALVLIENRTYYVLSDYNIIKEDDERKKYYIDNVFVDWCNYALFQFVRGKVDNKELEFVYKKYKRHFDGIQIKDENYETVINKIMNQMIDSEKMPVRYHQPINNKKIDKNIHIDEKFNEKLDSETIPIPINEEIIKEKKDFLKKFYILMYIYTGLKKYRNTVAHPNPENNNFSNGYRKVKDLSVDETEMWIQLYINVLVDVLSQGKKQ